MRNKGFALIIIALFLFQGILVAQEKASDFFNSDQKVIWYGFDFSHAKYIGAMSNGAGQTFASTREFKYVIIPQLNGLVLKEADKYDLENIFKKSSIEIDTSFVNKVNNKIDEKEFQTYDNIEYIIQPSQFQDYITKLAFSNADASFGMVVFVESINKIKNKGSYYITVFDSKSKEIVFVEHLEGRLLGMGLKNYCAGSINFIFDEIKKTYYHQWEKKYVKK